MKVSGCDMKPYQAISTYPVGHDENDRAHLKSSGGARRTEQWRQAPSGSHTLLKLGIEG